MIELTENIPNPDDVGATEYQMVHQLVAVADTLGDAVHSLEELICYAADVRAQLTKHDPGAAGMPRRRIVSAAMQNKDTGRIVMCVRHRDEIFRNGIKQGESVQDFEDGFIDNRRMFLTREEAWPIAAKAGQIIRRCGGDGKALYSENIC